MKHYFPHDYYARQDVKIAKLIINEGYAGYGLFWSLVELLYQNEGEINYDLELISRLLNHNDKNQLQNIIEKYDLFEIKNNVIGNNRIKETIKRLKDVSKIRQSIAQKRWNNKQDNIKKVENESEENNKVPYKEIIDLYHQILPELPKVQVLTERRKQFLKQRWYEDIERQNLDWWKSYFEKVKSCKFLLGNNDNNWQADFEWLIRQNNLPKVLEGRYDKLGTENKKNNLTIHTIKGNSSDYDF